MYKHFHCSPQTSVYEQWMERNNHSNYLRIIIKFNEILIWPAHINNNNSRGQSCCLPFQETCNVARINWEGFGLIWYWGCLLVPRWSCCENNSYWSLSYVLNVRSDFLTTGWFMQVWIHPLHNAAQTPMIHTQRAGQKSHSHKLQYYLISS